MTQFFEKDGLLLCIEKGHVQPLVYHGSSQWSLYQGSLQAAKPLAKEVAKQKMARLDADCKEEESQEKARRARLRPNP